MTTKPKPSAVVFAKDVRRLAHFYQAVAGMAVQDADLDAKPAHVVLDDGGFQLVIHGIPPNVAAAIAIQSPPVVREDTPIKICLPVASIEAARSQAAALGGQIGPKRKQWTARGFTACDGFDPEGNVFQVRESAA